MQNVFQGGLTAEADEAGTDAGLAAAGPTAWKHKNHKSITFKDYSTLRKLADSEERSTTTGIKRSYQSSGSDWCSG